MEKVKQNKTDYEIMLDKLKYLYNKKDDIKKKVKLLLIEYEQVKEDIEMTELFIMYKTNRDSRGMK